MLCRELPPLVLLPFCAVVTIALMVCGPTRLAGFAAAGFVLCWGASADVIADRLVPAEERKDIDRLFRIVDFVDPRSRNPRLLVSPIDDPDLPRRIRLSWFEPSEVPRFGECWRLEVRLRRPRGLSNPGVFDYERWLFRSGIGASGYVREGVRVRDCAPPHALAEGRARLAERLAERLPEDDAGAVLLAITVGARHRIGRDQWQRYASTGTSHLMAISGMHIGLAAGAALLLSRLSLLCVGARGSHRDMALMFALLVAVAYAALSGFAVPARRALTMVVIAACGALLRRPVAGGPLIAVTCMIALLLDPVSIFSPGFQLSFAAVAALLWLLQRRHGGRGPDAQSATWRDRMRLRAGQLAALQVGLLFGLFALTLANFGRAAWLAPAVNLVVLPVFNLVTVPCALSGAALDGPLAIIGDALLQVAWWSVRGILGVVHWASEMPGATLERAMSGGIAAVAVGLAVVWVVLPVGWPGRRVAVLAIAAALFSGQRLPPEDCADVHVLDVGQGLSTVVQTRRRVLIFDTGPAFRSGTDTGSLVVVPFLSSLGVAQVDLLIISHADNDHAGGVSSVLGSLPTEALLVGETLAPRTVPQYPCSEGQLWEWDGVRFRILSPRASRRRDGNNSSCVLEIGVGAERVLLSGDIEAAVERELVMSGSLSPVALAVVPHHGSATSSHPGFVAALRPRFAIATAGFDNRWGMPKPEVRDRWRSVGATFIETSKAGAVSFRLCKDSGLEKRHEHRLDERRFWHET